MSEVPYMAVALLGLIYLERGLSRPEGCEAMVVGIVLSFLGCLLRTAGVALPVALVVALCMRRRWAEAVLPAVGVVIVVLMAPAYGREFWAVSPYYPELGSVSLVGLAQRIGLNALWYGFHGIPSLILPFLYARPMPGVGPEVFFSGAILAGLGWYLWAWGHKGHILALYLAVHLGMCLLWPEVWADVRFLVPVIPIIFLAVVWSGCRVMRRLPRAQVAVLTLVILAGASTSWAQRQTAGVYPPEWDSYFGAARWVREHIREDVVVACRKPSLFEVVSGRQCVSYPYGGPHTVVAHLERNRVGLVVLDRLGYPQTVRHLLPAIREFKAQFSPIVRGGEPATLILGFKARGEDGKE
uniref:Glycosyltransferase RgtA/B/C/D-like domain-containing protein n=1 Tax=viral metagenome TaxID=1070528 RepID=A0A6M3LF67_9ZZZZ